MNQQLVDLQNRGAYGYPYQQAQQYAPNAGGFQQQGGQQFPQQGGQPYSQQQGGQYSQFGGSQQYGGGQFPQQGSGYPQQGGYANYGQRYGQAPPTNVAPNIASWFQSVDTDRSGMISAPELVNALAHGGFTGLTVDAASSMIKMFNSSGTGQLNLMEFQHLATFLNIQRNSFQQMDLNHSGSLDYNEVQRALQVGGHTFDPNLLHRIVSKYDRTRSGSLRLDGFIELVVFLGLTKEVFDAHDTQRRGAITFSFDQFLSAAVAMQFGLNTN